ncbi:MAG: hypothetical protein BWY83_00527 [bacterium ADurb.Bin478]|nr:MAG: hypothetical protein BWY83_00527 [bacterium ADurb.Bin478]
MHPGIDAEIKGLTLIDEQTGLSGYRIGGNIRTAGQIVVDGIRGLKDDLDRISKRRIFGVPDVRLKVVDRMAAQIQAERVHHESGAQLGRDRKLDIDRIDLGQLPGRPFILARRGDDTHPLGAVKAGIPIDVHVDEFLVRGEHIAGGGHSLAAAAGYGICTSPAG